MHTDLQLNLLTNLSSDNDTSISSSPSSSTSLPPPPPSANPPPPAPAATSNTIVASSEQQPITSRLSQNNSDLNSASFVSDIFDSLLEQITLGIYFDLFKSFRLNSIKVQDSLVYTNEVKKSEHPKKRCDNSNVDIFGHSLNGIKKLECVCPNCSRTLAASRLAPHLEKCMGMGRNSSRLASKRIAHFIKNSNGTSSE